MGETKQVSYRFNSKDIEWFREFCENRRTTAAEGFSMLRDLVEKATGKIENEFLVLHEDVLSKIDKEIEVRKASGEDVFNLFANICNEHSYIRDSELSEPERRQYLETMMFALCTELASEYMMKTGWRYTEKDRWVFSKEA